MAQTGYTPIQLYYSSTTTNAPLAANLAYGELAINITDGKLFYKDNANAIQVIGWKVVPATAGGTGQTSYAVGDLIYADTTTSLAKLPDVATGNALISGGVGVAPSWGKIGLTTHVSGTLPTANGGTNLTSFTSGGVVYASSTSALATGSALTFDGTNLATTGNITLANTKILRSDATTSYIGIAGGTSLSSSQGAAIYLYGNTNAGTGGMYVQTGNVTGADLIFAPRDSEAMRIFATRGISIGNTTDPGAGKLSVGTSAKALTTVSGNATSAAVRTILYKTATPTPATTVQIDSSVSEFDYTFPTNGIQAESAVKYWIGFRDNNLNYAFFVTGEIIVTASGANFTNVYTLVAPTYYQSSVLSGLSLTWSISSNNLRAQFTNSGGVSFALFYMKFMA